MKRVFFTLVLCLVATANLAATPEHTVTIDGQTYYTGYTPRHVENARYLTHQELFSNLDKVPTTYDAVAEGRATPVKSPGQGQCGDCWAWARTSSLEAASLAAGVPSPFASLSEQDLTVNDTEDMGCDGGSMNFDYETSHGLTSLSACPWSNGTGTCATIPLVQATSMAFLGDETAGPTDAELEAAIYKYGSVAVTVAADGNFKTDANSDRMTSCATTEVDHMVSLVGFRPAADGGVEYKMKNSWDTSWGAEGYAYLKIGCNQLATGSQSAMVITDVKTP